MAFTTNSKTDAIRDLINHLNTAADVQDHLFSMRGQLAKMREMLSEADRTLDVAQDLLNFQDNVDTGAMSIPDIGLFGASVSVRTMAAEGHMVRVKKTADSFEAMARALGATVLKASPAAWEEGGGNGEIADPAVVHVSVVQAPPGVVYKRQKVSPERPKLKHEHKHMPSPGRSKATVRRAGSRHPRREIVTNDG